MTTLRVNLGTNSYDITVGRGILSEAKRLFDLNRRVVIITDSGVPREYAERVAALCAAPKIITVPEGEGSKSLDTFAMIEGELISFGMTRSDAIVAVGGGVCGDLAGFCAASYMRGIDFYNIPTTLLSQVDSSIGGKTAVNHAGVKNVVGAFHQPRGVLIDLDVLSTLPKRQIASGLAEVLKMALTFDEVLFSEFERLDSGELVNEKTVVSALELKRRVVECDEREGGLRKVLNFGHTFGHAIEANEELRGFYHGECVALGMTYMCSGEVRERLIAALERLGLPTVYDGDVEAALEYITHDKKCEGALVSTIYVDEVGKYRIEKLSLDELSRRILAYHGK